MSKSFAAILLCLLVAIPTLASAQAKLVVSASDSQNRRVDYARVTLDLEPVDGTPDVTGTTDIFGMLTLPNVPPGTYTVTVTRPGNTDFVQTGVVFGSGQTVTIDVQLGDSGGTTFIDLDFAIMGAHTAARLVGAQIDVDRWDTPDTTTPPARSYPIMALTGGITALKRVPVGYYGFSVWMPGWETYFVPATYYAQSQSVRVALKPTYANLTVAVFGLNPTKDPPLVEEFKGALVEVTGVALDDDDVTLVPPRSLHTSASGVVTFNDLPKIRWKVRVSRLGYYTETVIVGSNLAGAFDTVNVTLGIRPQAIAVFLDSPYDNFKPVEGADVVLNGLKDSNTEKIKRTIAADSQGIIQFIDILPGRYHLSVPGHVATVTGLPAQSGSLAPGPTEFTVRFGAVDTYIEINTDESLIKDIALEPMPATIFIELQASDEIRPVDAFDGEAARVFHSITTDAVEIAWHETVNALATGATQSLPTDAEGTLMVTVLPGRYGFKLPNLTDYSGYEVVYEDTTGEFPSQTYGWPYPDTWTPTDSDPDRHIGWLHFSSGYYRVRLNLHRHYINWVQLLGWDFTKDPCPKIVVGFEDAAAQQPILVDWIDAVHGGGMATMTGTASASAPLGVLSGWGKMVFTDLQPGTYNFSATHPRMSFDTVSVTIGPWAAPGVIPPTVPNSSEDYFPGSDYGDFTRKIVGTYNSPDPLIMEMWQWNSGSSSYDHVGDRQGGQYYSTDYIPQGTLCAAVVGNLPPPTGQYTAYRETTAGQWYATTRTGGGTVQVYYGTGGTSNNVSSGNKPSTTAGYDLKLLVKSTTDSSLDVPGITVEFVDGNTAPGGFDGQYHGSPTATGISTAGSGTWLFDWSEVKTLDPTTPSLEVTVYLKRATVVSGTVTVEGTPVADANVTFYNRRGGVLANVVTAADGTFNEGQIDPQTVYIGLNVRGTKPYRKRFVPQSAAEPDIDTGTIDLERLPLPDKPEFLINRYGLFIPGVSKSGDDSGYNVNNAASGLTATWTADITPDPIDYTLDGFEVVDGVSTPEPHTVQDEVALVCVVDKRGFTEPFINASSITDRVFIDPPWSPAGSEEAWEDVRAAGGGQKLFTYDVANWLTDMRANKDAGGSPLHIAYDCTSIKETVTISGADRQLYTGSFKLWELPPGDFDPRLIVITKAGMVGVLDSADWSTQYNEESNGSWTEVSNGPGARPPKGLRLPQWAQFVINAIGVASTVVPDLNVADFVPTDKFLPTPTFASAILTSNGYLTYDIRMGLDFQSGQMGPGTGILSAGPRNLGLGIKGDTKVGRDTKLTNASLKFLATGEDDKITLGVIIKASKSAEDMVGPYVPQINIGLPLPRIDKDETKLTGSVEAAVVDQIHTGFLALSGVPDFKMRLAATAFLKARLLINILPLAQKIGGAIPVAGPFIAATILTFDAAGGEGDIVIDIGIGGAYSFTTATFFPTFEATIVAGQPNITHLLGGANPQHEATHKVKLRLLFGVGLRLAAAAGRASLVGTIQVGAPTGATAPGVDLQFNPEPLKWPPIVRVRGALSVVVTAKLKVWGVEAGRTFQKDALTFDRHLGTEPWHEIVSVQVTYFEAGASTSSSATFRTSGAPAGTPLLAGLFPFGKLSSTGGTSPELAYVDVDPAGGGMRIMVSAYDGSEWLAPTELAIAGAVLGLDTVETAAGGTLVVWTQIAQADVGKAFPSSQVYYAVADAAGTWAAPVLLATETNTAHEVNLTLAGTDVVLVYQVTDEGPASNMQQLRAASWNGAAWTAVQDLLSKQNISRVALTGATTANALLAVASGTGELQTVHWTSTGWSAATSVATVDAGNAVALAYQASGDALMVWERNDGTLVVSSWSAAGGTWTELGAPLTAQPQEIALLPVTINATPMFLVVWIEGGDVSRIHYAYLGVDGTLQSAVIDATPSSGGSYSQLELRQDGAGDPVLIASLEGGGTMTVDELVVPFVPVCTLGTACDDGFYCTVNDTCDADGYCSGDTRDCASDICSINWCDEENDACVPEILDAGAMCTSDQDPCTIDACDGSSVTSCMHTVEPNSCSIAGSCFADGAADPANPCQVCDSVANSTGWTVLAAGEICGAASCDSFGDLIPAATCDGVGACGTPMPVSCGATVCANGACPVSCTGDTDCQPPATCVSSFCSNQAPTADAGPDQQILQATSVTLDGRRSVDPDGNAITYVWTQTVGPTMTLSDDTAAAPTFVAPTLPGTTPVALVFTLVVNDGALDSPLSTTTITVLDTLANQPPVALISGPDTAAAGATIQLDGSGSSDADADAITVLWAQHSGSVVELAAPISMQLSVTLPADLLDGDVVEVSLIVNDGQANSAIAVHAITVQGAIVTPPSSGGTSKEKGGCGCNSSGASMALTLLLFVVGAGLRRRRIGRAS